MIINSVITTVTPPTEGYRVRFFDYDGTLLKTQMVESGNAATPPSVPVHSGLTFQEWNKDFDNITRNTDVGPTFVPTDGKTHLFIRCTAATGKNMSMFFIRSTSMTITVNWGDGFQNDYTGTGTANPTHNYATVGDYEITVWISSGTGYYSISTNFSGSTQPMRDRLLSTWIGTDCRLAANTFTANYTMQSVVIPNHITVAAGMKTFYQCYNLNGVVLPRSITLLPDQMFYNCFATETVILPATLTSIGANTFASCAGLVNFCLPESVGTIGASAFTDCQALEELTLPTNTTSIGSSAFNNCSSVKGTVSAPATITSSNSSVFYNCYDIERFEISGMSGTLPATLAYNCYGCKSILVNEGITSIGTNSFLNCYGVTTIELPSTLTSISNGAFTGDYACQEVVCLATVPPTLASVSAFGYNNQTKFYVPDASVAAYKAATNWISIANFIYPLSTRPV